VGVAVPMWPLQAVAKAFGEQRSDEAAITELSDTIQVRPVVPYIRIPDDQPCVNLVLRRRTKGIAR
jgi:hypothetical protein